jgi:conjugative transfer pilus assembly protein TraH
MRYSILKTITAVVIITVFGFSYAFADMSDYMTNTLSQIQSLTPHAYQGQQRGYFVGGTMHVPPLGQTIQPFSISLPSIQNNSCGGINAMMGGFSYLNFQYLVQKLQGIIQAAPALAFEIAIKVLSEKLGGVMNGLEQITNAINGLNFSSCTAMNGIVNTASNAITNAISGSASATTQQQSSGGSDWFGSGITNFVSNVKEGWNKMVHNLPVNTNTPAGQNDAGFVPTQGVLAYANSLSGNLPSSFINTLRYYVGDVTPSTVSGDNSTVSNVGVYVPGCDNNAQSINKNLAYGYDYNISYTDFANGQCGSVQASQNQNNLVTQVKGYLNEIYNDLSNNQDLNNPGVVNFINSSRIPVYSFMREAAMLQSPAVSEQLINELSEPIAYEFAANVAAKLTSVVNNTIGSIAVQAATDASGMNNDSYLKALEQLKTALTNFQRDMIQASNDSLIKAQAIYGNFINQYSILTAQVQQQMQQQGNNLSKALAFQKNLNK